ncbi:MULTISPECIES: hypothetical protein [unclassified Nocardiopsis]|uniref:hypothetical protein n=1 Tax=unclassified Nocardiopsis TaxID=2649073 RepID=UPI0033CEA7B0
MNDALVALAVWTVLTLISASQAWEAVRSARADEGPRAFRGRWAVLRRCGGVVLVAAYALWAVAWLHLPVALWWVNTGLVAVALGAGASRWHHLRWRHGPVPESPPDSPSGTEGPRS